MMKRMLMAVAATLAAVVSNAATYYASPDGTGSGAQGDPCSLMDAVAKVNADQGGEIVLATGTYQEAENVTGTSTYDSSWNGSRWTSSYYLLGKSGQNYPITVRSATGKPEDVILLGRRADNKNIRLFRVYGNAVKISGITMSDCQENTTLHGGGAIFGSSDDSAGPFGGSLIENCIIKDCSSCVGAAIYKVDAVNCTFIGNTTSDSGGAVCKANVSNCTFKANYCNGRSAVAALGGGRAYSAYDSTFLCNTNCGAGNALDSGLVSGLTNVVRCVFADNVIQDNSRHCPGCYDVANVIDSYFTNNISASGLVNTSSAWLCNRVSGCTFAESNCASVVKSQAGGAISNCTFSACRNPSYYYGGLLMGDGTTEVVDTTFLNCTNASTALRGDLCGAMIYNAKFVERCRFVGCSSPSCALLYSVASLMNCIFTNNTTDRAAWVRGKTGAVVTNCLFAGNVTKDKFLDDAIRDVSELVNCTIADNTMPKMLPIASRTVRNSILVGNSPYDCGAVTLDHTFYGTANPAPTVIGEGSRSAVTVSDIKFRGENAKGLPPFALKPKSPARGAGQTLSGQSDQLDLAGHPRVAEGQNVDLGAYAYFPAPFGLMLMLK